MRAATSYDCLIEPTQTVEVGMSVGGILDRVMVKRGDLVRRNQVLASLQSRVETAAVELARYKAQMSGQIELAQSKIAFAKRKFERLDHMASERLMSRQDSDDAEAQFKQAQAELKVAEENREVARLEYVRQNDDLSMRTLRSPFDGVVVDQMMWPGETVEPGASKHAILKLAQLDPLRIRVVMPMQAFGKPRRGMPVTVTTEVQPGMTYQAKVSGIDRLIDAASGTFVVFLDLPNPDLKMPSGMKCRAQFANLTR